MLRQLSSGYLVVRLSLRILTEPGLTASITCAQATPSASASTEMYQVCICELIHSSSSCLPKFINLNYSSGLNKNIDHHNYSSATGSTSSASAGSTHSYWVCSLSHCTMPSASRPPLYSSGSADLSLPQYLRVGKPWMSTPETSFSVESTLTSKMLGLLAILRAASSQWGARCLQWPHQGAQNSTNTSCSELRTTSLKFLPTTTFTGSSLGSGMGADLRKGSSSPLLTWVTKLARFSAEISPASNLNFSALPLRKST